LPSQHEPRLAALTASEMPTQERTHATGRVSVH
jgi:hypothetical protein